MDRRHSCPHPLAVIAFTASLLLTGCSQPQRVYKIAYAGPSTPAAEPWNTDAPQPHATPLAQAAALPQPIATHYQPAFASHAPSPLAAPTDVYHVGPGDILEVRIDQLLEPEKEAILIQAVDPRGRVYLPLLHHVPVSGKTCEQIRNDLVLRLGQEFIRDPKVDVAVKEYGSKRVVVLGAVGRPGTVALRSDVATLMDVISDVGGIQPNAAPTVEILRGAYTAGDEPRLHHVAFQPDQRPAGQREIVPVARLFSQGPDQVNPAVYPGDVVQVPEGSEGYIYIAGEVEKPGALQYRRPLGLLQAVACAGGATRVAKQDQCSIVRRTPEGREEVFHVNLDKVRSGDEANVQLAMNDTIILPTDPVKKFVADVDNFIRRGIFAGVELTYDAGSEMGWPQSTRY